MKIREFVAAGESKSTLPFTLKLSKPKGVAANCFTILVGANGTRKSRTLRDIVDIVVPGLSKDSALIQRKAGRIRFWAASAIPRVIAVSGVATDRFPSRLNARRGRSSRTIYSYIGPRTDSNLVSRVQAVQQIALAMLADHEVLKNRSVELRKVFAILQLDAGMYFELEIAQMPPRGGTV